MTYHEVTLPTDFTAEKDGDSVRYRLIPAWAGKPVRRWYAFVHFWVYPRVGGETQLVPNLIQPILGLSPRGRGNRTLAAPPARR